MASGYPDWQSGVKADIIAQTLTELTAGIRTYLAEAVEWIVADSSATVSSGSLETIIVRAPAGYVYEVLAIRLDIDPPYGATAGEHSFTVMSENAFVNLLYGASDYATAVIYNYNIWARANVLTYPASDAGQVLAVKGTRIDSNSGLRIDYRNDTDADQTNNRIVRLWVRKIRVS